MAGERERGRPVLARGAVGPDVRELQERLRALGFYTARPDGAFGPRTELAVIRFQRSRGLVADGFVGPATRRALGI